MSIGGIAMIDTMTVARLMGIIHTAIQNNTLRHSTVDLAHIPTAQGWSDRDLIIFYVQTPVMEMVQCTFFGSVSDILTFFIENEQWRAGTKCNKERHKDPLDSTLLSTEVRMYCKELLDFVRKESHISEHIVV